MSDEDRQQLGRLGDMGWHPLEDVGDEGIAERFEKLPILVQRALVRLAYTVIDSSPQETDEADMFFRDLTKDESPLWESPKRHLRALQEVRGSVATQIIINRHTAPSGTD